MKKIKIKVKDNNVENCYNYFENNILSQCLKYMENNCQKNTKRTL